MRKTLLLFVASILAGIAWGQSYTYYCWIDDDPTIIKSGSATGEIQLDVNISSLNAGLHLLHVQASQNNKGRSSVRTLYFIKPEQSTATTARYWIDNDPNTLHNGVTTSGVIDLDIASLKAGLHVVHYQTFNAKGDASTVHTLCFLITEQNTATTARYWIDNDPSTLHNGIATNGVIDLDISKLGVGMHVVHYQTFNAKGDASPVRTKHFIVDQVQIGTLTANIAIDDGETTNYALSEEDIEIDISELADGRHELSVTLIDGGGSPVGQKVKEFIVGDTRDVQTMELAAIPEMTYGAEAYTLPQATAEGLDLTWGIDDDAVASINGNVLTVVGAGTAIVTATQDGDESYQPFSREFTLTVNKAMLTITANNSTKQEGDATPELTVSYDGFVYDDDATSLTTQPTATTTATIDSPAGTYPITVSGAASDNYEFTYVEGILTVTQKPIVIVVTDIAQLDDAIYIMPFTARIGTEVQMEICLKNAQAATAYNFDLVLPEGVTVAKNAQGKYIDALSDRHDDHSRTFNYKGNNTYAFATLSGNSEELTGNDGTIRIVTLAVDETAAEGVYPIIIKNASYSLPNSNLVELPETMSSITLESYVQGDVNGNNGVDIGDAVAIVNYLVGKPSTTFVIKAADTNKNGGVDIGDAVAIVNYLVGKTETLSRRVNMEDNKREPQ